MIPRSLVELEAEFAVNVADGRIGRSDSLSDADGVMFLCPKCFSANNGAVGTHRVVCWFRGRVANDVKPGPGRWAPSGSNMSDLSLSPSVQLTGGGCDWHGFVTNGSAK